MRNKIDKLIKLGGEVCEGELEVTKEIPEFFQTLFMSYNPCEGNNILGDFKKNH